MTLAHFQSEATAAVVSGGCLYIATVKADRDGRLRLVKSRSGEVRLTDRTQLSLQMFAKFLAEFLGQREITKMTFICSPERGGHMAAASSYKIEAVVQLMPLAVNLLHAASVTMFADRAGTNVPAPDKDRLHREACRMQSRAILAAVHELRVGETAAAAALEDKVAANDPALPKPDETPEECALREAEAARREAEALKSKRARERREARRVEARLEQRALAALEEELEYERSRKPKKLTKPKKPAAPRSSDNIALAEDGGAAARAPGRNLVDLINSI